MKIVERKNQSKKTIPAVTTESMPSKVIPAATELNNDRTIKEPSAGTERCRVLAIMAMFPADEFKSLVSDAIKGGWTLKYTRSAAFDLVQAKRKIEGEIAAAKSEVAAAKTAELQARIDILAAAKKEYGDM